MYRLVGVILALLWGAAGFNRAQAQDPLSRVQMEADIHCLDSIFYGHEILSASSLSSLSSRDDLIRLSQVDSAQNQLSWGVMVHQWLRSADDAHMRVRFERMADSLSKALPPSSDELLMENGPWEAFAPGRGTPQCARLAWQKKTWPWLGALVPNGAVQARSEKEALDDGLSLRAGMSVVDHGAFVRWVIRDFSSGKPSEFRRSYRRCTRELRKAGTPVLLDLRGNLGGFRTRRHAVLGFFLPQSDWPEEREAEYNSGGLDSSRCVSPMPAVRVPKVHAASLAVLVDGLSFSASLLLLDALLMSDRAGVFGVQPLGQSGGCSGSPADHMLTGSGLVVTCPTLRTTIGSGPLADYGLPDDASPEAGQQAWKNAVLWLLSADLETPR